MKRLRRSHQDDAKIDITPMLDVVFIMLIFFIVTANFVKQSGADVIKPEAVTAERKDNTAVLIAINSKDEIWIDQRKIDARAVKVNIARLRSENPEGGVVLQADENSTTEVVMKVVDGLREAGIPVPVISTVAQ